MDHLPDASPSPQVQDLLEPLHDLLLVERDPDQEKIGRIYLADNSSLGKSQLGTVIKAGPRSQSYLDRRIVFSVGAGILLKSSGLLLLSPADILALIKIEGVADPVVEAGDEMSGLELWGRPDASPQFTPDPTEKSLSKLIREVGSLRPGEMLEVSREDAVQVLRSDSHQSPSGHWADRVLEHVPSSAFGWSWTENSDLGKVVFRRRYEPVPEGRYTYLPPHRREFYRLDTDGLWRMKETSDAR